MKPQKYNWPLLVRDTMDSAFMPQAAVSEKLNVRQQSVSNRLTGLRNPRVENTEIIPNYERYEEFEGKIGNYGVTVTEAFRTPMQTINIDIAGTERFCMDFGMEIPGLFELHEAIQKQCMTIVGILGK